MKKILLCFLILSSLLLTGCFSGLVDDETYESMIFGVEAETTNGELYYYNLNILKDNEEFNKEIRQLNYCKLDIRQAKEIKVKGVVFLVRSSQKAQLTFSAFANDILVQTCSIFLEQNKVSEVTLFFDDTQTISVANKLTIRIEENTQKDDGKQQEYIEFAFDSLLIFFDE